MKPRRI